MTTRQWESFWGSLKNEMIHHQRYVTRLASWLRIASFVSPKTLGKKRWLLYTDVSSIDSAPQVLLVKRERAFCSLNQSVDHIDIGQARVPYPSSSRPPSSQHRGQTNQQKMPRAVIFWILHINMDADSLAGRVGASRPAVDVWSC